MPDHVTSLGMPRRLDQDEPLCSEKFAHQRAHEVDRGEFPLDPPEGWYDRELDENCVVGLLLRPDRFDQLILGGAQRIYTANAGLVYGPAQPFESKGNCVLVVYVDDQDARRYR